MTTKNPIRSRTTEMKIGRTVYIVTSSFNESAKETVEQKLMRLISDRASIEIKSRENAVI